jgi:hypothetical membrane protein
MRVEIDRKSVLWRQRAFSWVIVACLQFVVLTVAAMIFYPGGTVTDPTARGYSFFENFFSDLGRTVSPLGEPNTMAAILFAGALALAGAGLAVFFVASLGFFSWPRLAKLLSGLGSVFGVLSGLAFVGVACTPANVLLEPHRWFVLMAFRAFLPAVICYTAAILATPAYPNRFAFLYLGFAALLAAYLQLLMRGPAPGTPEGLVIQATGQKIIVYAAIVCSFFQALGARRLATHKGGGRARPDPGR